MILSHECLSVCCSAPSAGAWGSVSDAHDVRRGIRAWWIWRRKWTILGVAGMLVYIFFRYGGVGPPPQDNDFVLTRGSEVSCALTCLQVVLPAQLNLAYLLHTCV
jgi:hypothetical protein